MLLLLCMESDCSPKAFVCQSAPDGAEEIKEEDYAELECVIIIAGEKTFIRYYTVEQDSQCPLAQEENGKRYVCPNICTEL